MKNKYLSDLHSKNVDFEKMRLDFFKVSSASDETIEKPIIVIATQLFTKLTRLLEVIEEKNKESTKMCISELIVLLGGLSQGFFDALKIVNAGNEKLEQKYKLTDDELFEVEKNYKEELEVLRDLFSKVTDFSFSFQK